MTKNDKYKTQGAIIRIKEKLILIEEKPTKYFSQQQQQQQKKQQQKQKLNKRYIKYSKIKGKILEKNTEILEECKNFYEILYKKQKTCELTQQKMQNGKHNKLAQQKRENGKLPRIDGVSI